MPDQLTDIKETDFGITPVSEYVISRAKDSSGEEFSVTLPDIDTAYGPGSDVNFKGMSGFVTSREYVSGPQGYQTVISGVSRVVDVIRKAPAKTLMFMSMTPNEMEEFFIANMDNSGKADFSGLDYIPLIKPCDERTFMGGWTSGDVISNLVGRIGLNVVCNVRSYYLRQVQADVQSSFFDTIMSLVNFLRPTVYIDEDTLYILNRPFRNGSVSFDRIAQAAQRETYNYNSKVNYVKFMGGLGAWNRAKYKGKIEPEKEVVITSVTGSSTQGQIATRFTGDTATIRKWMGTSSGLGDLNASASLPMTDETTTVEVYRIDPFGNNKALLCRITQTLNNLLGNPAAKTFESTEMYYYQFLDEQYDRPRLVKKITSVGKWVWELVEIGGMSSTRYYKQKVDVIEENFLFAPNGNLFQETMVRESDCIKLGDFITEIELGDYYWVQEGQSPPPGTYVRAIVEERVIGYRQINKDLYQRSFYHRSLGGLRRKAGDGLFKTSTEQIKGRVPKHPKTFRKMNVYAEETPGNSAAIMDAPAVIVGNPNVVGWGDAENLLSDIKRTMVDFQYTVNRQLVLPMEIDIDIGWPVTFDSLQAGKNREIPSVSVTDGMIAGWTRTKDAASPSVRTVVMLEGRVQ